MGKHVSLFYATIPPMLTVPTTEPAAIGAGDTVRFRITLDDFPATDGWALGYILVGRPGVPISWSSTASGADHLVSIAAATTAGYAAGLYNATRYVTKSATGERYTLGQFPLTVQPNPALITTATDTRSHAKRVLDAIEAVIEGRAGKGDQELTIDGTRLVRMTVEQLLILRTRYLAEYQAELRGATGGRFFRSVKVRL